MPGGRGIRVEESRLTLVGFLRGTSMKAYTGSERLEV